MKTILLVDDDPAYLELLCLSEALDGLCFLIARSPHHALALLPEADAMVTDLDLRAGIDGVALADECRRRRPSLPVGLVSGGGAPQETDPALPFLAKPFGAAEFMRFVNDMIASP